MKGECRGVRSYSSFAAGLVDVADENFGTFCCEGLGNTGAKT